MINFCIKVKLIPPQKETVFRNKLVDDLADRGIIKTEVIESAFRKVPRHLFLPKIPLEEVYSDASVITKRVGIEAVSSSTAPSLMAAMLESLQIKRGMKVLEVGAGTGYNAAILSEIVNTPRSIFTIDIDPETVQEAWANLDKAGYKEVLVECRSGFQGLPEEAPFDRIVVTASIRSIPRSLIDQLKRGGIITAPIWVNGTQIAPALKKREGILVSTSIAPGGYMEMRSETYPELLEGASKGLPGSKIIICSEYPELFEEKKLITLLKKGGKEEKLPLEGINLPRGGEFFPFLSLYERKSVELFLDEDPTESFDFGESAAGIVDLEAKSVCLISDDNRLLVYGSPEAYRKVLSLFHQWEGLKRPALDRWQVFVYFRARPRPKKGDLLFKEKLPPLMVRIKDGVTKSFGSDVRGKPFGFR